MKKTLFVFIAALFTVFSCSKTDGGNGDEIDLSGHTIFGVNTEQIDLMPGESFQDTWPEGASIGVFGESDSNVEFFLRRSGVAKSSTSFYGPKVEGDEIFAYYPYSSYTELEDDMLPCTLASEQQYVPELGATDIFRFYNPMTFASPDDSKVLKFCFPFGMLGVRICFDEILYVTKMTLSSENTGISGRMLVDGELEVKPSAVASGKTVLTFATPESTWDKSGTFRTFYFVMPPAEHAAKTLSLEIETTDGSLTVALRSLTIERVRGTEFPITNIVIDSSDLPGFTPVDGYLE